MIREVVSPDVYEGMTQSTKDLDFVVYSAAGPETVLLPSGTRVLVQRAGPLCFIQRVPAGIDARVLGSFVGLHNVRILSALELLAEVAE